jgi:hypothetical protein
LNQRYSSAAAASGVSLKSEKTKDAAAVCCSG